MRTQFITCEEYQILPNRIDIQFNNEPDPDRFEGIVLQNALRRIKAYEAIRQQILSSDTNHK
ncbi:hypothetical protein [Dyadobacter sp. CY356]|uniref:hypothetical protein n=1 Tax=Dyadobacter sp. CY356 TaxID=2906442 RepID=UPI001F465879|nr:hypothetical protein [Dyadobacter sp. CY356]MCF0054249.1 hypothetical protein [Dyadobacter sp. CY356]